MIYVCTLYSHKSKRIRQKRYEFACRIVADLIKNGSPAFSPIAYSHVLAIDYDMGTTWADWEYFDFDMLRFASCVLVVKSPGWKKSKGIKAEIAKARELKIPVIFRKWPKNG